MGTTILTEDRDGTEYHYSVMPDPENQQVVVITGKAGSKGRTYKRKTDGDVEAYAQEIINDKLKDGYTLLEVPEVPPEVLPDSARPHPSRSYGLPVNNIRGELVDAPSGPGISFPIVDLIKVRSPRDVVLVCACSDGYQFKVPAPLAWSRDLIGKTCRVTFTELYGSLAPVDPKFLAVFPE